MKAIFVYRNGKTFTARNVADMTAISSGGNVTMICYVRNLAFEAFQEVGESRVVDKANGLTVKRFGNERWQEAYEEVAVKVNKSELSYVIIETPIECSDVDGYLKHKQVSIIPCLDNFTGENIRDVIKAIS